MPVYTYKVCALYPKGHNDYKGNITTAFHTSYENAESVYKGLIGNTNPLYKPLKVWILPVTDIDIRCEQLKYVDIKK